MTIKTIKSSIIQTIIALLFTFNIAIAYDDSKNYGIFGIGQAEVDIIVFLSNEEFKKDIAIKYGFKKGELAYVDKQTIMTLSGKYKNSHLVPGGKVASVLAIYGSLGGTGNFNTIINNDEMGLIFYQDLLNYGIEAKYPKEMPEPTTLNIVFVTPDNQRTILSNKKDINSITQNQIQYHKIKNYKLVLAESSVCCDDEKGDSKKAVLRAFNTVKKINLLSALILNDISCINKHQSYFITLLQNIDILFCGEEEVKALFQEKNINEVIGKLQGSVPLSVITKGIAGGIIVSKNKVIEVPIDLRSDSNQDPTGADEAFIAGFLYGYLNDETLEESSKIAAKSSASIAKQIGARPLKVELPKSEPRLKFRAHAVY